MQILNKGEIGIVESMGTDHRIAEAAWVSYGKQEQDKPIEGVINYMMKHKHGTPFEHVVFTFYIKAPIFVAREWMRHRIGSFNEISGRYVTFEPEFYMPNLVRVKGSTNKQGSITPTDEWAEDSGWIDVSDFNDAMNDEIQMAYDHTFEQYETLLSNGVANEIARVVLPVGLYTQWYWTVNLRALLNFLNLRNADNAQWEIREYAKALERIVAEVVPVTYHAWLGNDRIAP